MKNLRLMALIVGVTLIPFTVNFALAESEGNAAKGVPAKASSEGKTLSLQPSGPTDEDFIREMAKVTFAEQDHDKDGKISHDEFIAPHEKRFKEIDANNDGFWTIEEFIDFEKKPLDTQQKRIFW